MRDIINKLRITESEDMIDEGQFADDLAEAITQVCENNNAPYNRVYISEIANKIVDDLINGNGADPYYQ